MEYEKALKAMVKNLLISRVKQIEQRFDLENKELEEELKESIKTFEREHKGLFKLYDDMEFLFDEIDEYLQAKKELSRLRSERGKLAGIVEDLIEGD